MLDPRTIETLLAEAVALQDWDTVAVCERALTGIISVATMKRLSPQACVVVQTLELRLAGVRADNPMVPEKYTEIALLTQDKAIERLEAKIGHRVDLDERDPAYLPPDDATAACDDVDVELELDVDVSDLAPTLPPTPRMIRVFSGLDLTELDDPDDDKTVIPS
jgi:hypothetical protein